MIIVVLKRLSAAPIGAKGFAEPNLAARAADLCIRQFNLRTRKADLLGSMADLQVNKGDLLLRTADLQSLETLNCWCG